jgi:hypothetical protein
MNYTLTSELTVHQFFKEFFCIFMEEEYSVSCSYVPVTIPYTETDRSIPHTKLHFLKVYLRTYYRLPFFSSLTALSFFQVQLRVILFRPKRAIITTQPYHSP